jgi:hypothetical protein
MLLSLVPILLQLLEQFSTFFYSTSKISAAPRAELLKRFSHRGQKLLVKWNDHMKLQTKWKARCSSSHCGKVEGTK